VRARRFRVQITLMRPAGAALALLLSALLLCLPQGASARGYESLGVLERQAVDEALLARGLEVDSAPAGRVVGTIHVFNHDVFSSRDWYFQVLNVFHRTTREEAIRREVLLRPGAAFDQEIVEESTRNLRNADFSNLVVILPVKASHPAKVDLLVVTRDVWSLRFNTDYEYQDGTLVYLTTSLSENNLFGWRKKVSLNFNLYRGAYALGPTYVDPNVSGTRLTFLASYRAWFNRSTGAHEGSGGRATLTYPLYSLASRWGASLDASHEDRVYRGYLQDMLRLVDLKGTPELEALPWIYRARHSAVVTSVTRSFGRRVVQRVSAGHSFSVRRTAVTDDFPEADEALRARFLREWAGPAERISALFAGYALFTPRYRVYRDLDTFDLREDAYVGPTLNLGVSRGLLFLGSETDHVGLSAGAGWSFDLGGGFQRISMSWSTRLDDGALTDRTVSAGAYFASPILLRTLRLTASAGASRLTHAQRRLPFTLGGEHALRGYALGEFVGKSQFLTHAEVRSRALSVASLRLGIVIFHDAGHAADSFSDLVPHHDMGLGLRLLIPQLNYYVIRCDWAFAFRHTMYTRAGWPGRFSAGFRQAF
jgi:hypothetical protein